MKSIIEVARECAALGGTVIESVMLAQALLEAVECLGFYDEWHQSTLDFRDALHSNETPLAEVGPNKARAFLDIVCREELKNAGKD